jgi:hypothetical protein
VFPLCIALVAYSIGVSITDHLQTAVDVAANTGFHAQEVNGHVLMS